MKRILLTLATAAVLCTGSYAHERITIGAKGGRVVYVDSTTIPNVEFVVNKDGQPEIALLDKERKPLPLEERSITVTAGPRASTKRLTVEKKGDAFLTAKMPEGAP